MLKIFLMKSNNSEKFHFNAYSLVLHFQTLLKIMNHSTYHKNRKNVLQIV
jgi:hypothetical protein